MKSLTILWQLTIGHEKEFAKFVRDLFPTNYHEDDGIGNDLANIIELFNEIPPTYEKNNYFLTNNSASRTLHYVYNSFNDYISKKKLGVIDTPKVEKKWCFRTLFSLGKIKKE
tara:strand:+ start:199 stop:537 length:339 start_codon:yes stop_codon:yes gene_type:complete